MNLSVLIQYFSYFWGAVISFGGFSPPSPSKSPPMVLGSQSIKERATERYQFLKGTVPTPTKIKVFPGPPKHVFRLPFHYIRDTLYTVDNDEGRETKGTEEGSNSPCVVLRERSVPTYVFACWAFNEIRQINRFKTK